MTTHTEATTSGYVLPPGEGERIWIVGDTMTIKATADSTAGGLAFFEVDTEPGAGPPPHVHAVESEYFYVLEGRFEFLIGDEVRGGGPGTFAFVPPGTVHRFACVGDGPGRILIAFTPGGIEGFFRESGRPAVDDGAPPPLDDDEIARTNDAGERYGLRVVDWSA